MVQEADSLSYPGGSGDGTGSFGQYRAYAGDGTTVRDYEIHNIQAYKGIGYSGDHYAGWTKACNEGELL